jgi:hypothetical protein
MAFSSIHGSTDSGIGHTLHETQLIISTASVNSRSPPAMLSSATPNPSPSQFETPAKPSPLIFFEMPIVNCRRAYYLCPRAQLFPVFVVNHFRKLKN